MTLPKLISNQSQSQITLLHFQTNKLSKAHVTRDSSGPAALTVSVGIQQ